MEKLIVAITTFNEKRERLERSINSILAQTGADITIIVSSVTSDKNADWIKSQKNIISIFTDEKEHPGHSPEGSFMQLNKAIELAKTMDADWFCFFSGDDYMKSGYTQYCFHNIENHPEKVIYTDYRIVTLKNKRRAVKLHPYDRKRHQRGNMITDIALIKKELLELAPLRSEKLGNYAFWDFWLRVYEKHGNTFRHVPKVSWVYHLREDSMHIMRKRKEKTRKKYYKDKEDFLKLHPL